MQRAQALDAHSAAVLAELDFNILETLGISEQAVVLASVAFSSISLAVNFFGGVATEKTRAELQLELERGKLSLKQMEETQGLIARYRGPALESAIDLEQALFHLVTDGPFQQRSAAECAEDVRYLLFTLAQFLGFLEVARRESPREQAFLQVDNPFGTDTISALNEGIRFVLCASPHRLEQWWRMGASRPHPGNRGRKSQSEILRECQGGTCAPQRSAGPEDRMRVPRGMQRAIGTYMVITPWGAERHYTQSYGDFHARLDADPAFARWFQQLEADALELATGPFWQGERPFPMGRWTRVLLLQQLLVDLMDVLDPDCVRLPLARRSRLRPVKYGPLPSIEQYQAQLKEMSRASALSCGQADKPAGVPQLEGIRDLLLAGLVEESQEATAEAEGSQQPAGGSGQQQQQRQQGAKQPTQTAAR